MITLNNYSPQVQNTKFTLTGESNCYWIPDSQAVSRNAVFIGDRVVLSGSWGFILSTSDEDGLVRVTLDGTTIGSYYATKNPVTGRWNLEVDITYLLKDLTEPYSDWGDPYTTKAYTPRTIAVTTENTDSVSCSVDIVILEGFSLLRMPHPIYEELVNVDSGYVYSIAGHSRVDPPNVMLRCGDGPYSHGVVCHDVWFECGDGWYDINRHGAVTNTLVTDFGTGYSNGNGGSVCQDFAIYAGIAYKGKTSNYKILWQWIGDYPCKDYCIVRWKSCTGNWRQHIFEVRNITDNLDGSTMTDPMGTDYRTITESSYQFDIHLSGLTRYSLWYYQDLLTSKDISMHFIPAGQLLEVAGITPTTGKDGMTPCSVVNPKKYTAPNGNSKLYDFDCTLKYKKTGY